MKYNRVINKNSTANVFKISLLRTVFFCLFFAFCLNINSQSKLSNLSNLTEKGIIYFMLKVNQNALTDDCIKTIFTNTRWFDLYVNHFDKENYDLYSKDEFKWPSYSQKIVSEMLTGIEKSDFNKLYTCICTARLGQYDIDSKKFPVELRFYPILQVGERRFSNIVTFNIAGRNLEYFDLALEMNLDIAEKFIDSRKDANGNIDRNIEAQVVFNVVNTSNDDLNRGDAKYLGVYIHSITFFDGSKIFGEIKPKNDFYDKVKLIYEAPRPISVQNLLDLQVSNAEDVPNILNPLYWSKDTGQESMNIEIQTNEKYIYEYNYNENGQDDTYYINYTRNRWSNPDGEMIQLLQRINHSNIIDYHPQESQFISLESVIKTSFSQFYTINYARGGGKSIYRNGNMEISFIKLYHPSRGNSKEWVDYLIEVLDKSDLDKIKPELCSNCKGVGQINSENISTNVVSRVNCPKCMGSGQSDTSKIDQSNIHKLTIIIKQDGLVHLEFDKPEDKLKALVQFGNDYNISFTDSQIKSCLEQPIIGIPIGKMQSFFDKLKEYQDMALVELGIPTEPNNNQFRHWIAVLRDTKQSWSITVKVNSGAPESAISSVTQTLQDFKLGKYSIVTN